MEQCEHKIEKSKKPNKNRPVSTFFCWRGALRRQHGSFATILGQSNCSERMNRYSAYTPNSKLREKMRKEANIRVAKGTDTNSSSPAQKVAEEASRERNSSLLISGNVNGFNTTCKKAAETERRKQGETKLKKEQKRRKCGSRPITRRSKANRDCIKMLLEMKTVIKTNNTLRIITIIWTSREHKNKKQ